MLRTALSFDEGRYAFTSYRFVKGEAGTYVYHERCLSNQEVQDVDELFTFMTRHECHE